MLIARSSIANDLDDMVLEVVCHNCGRLMTVTLQEVRTGRAVPCPSCEAWVALWDVEGHLQALHQLALIVDDRMDRARS